MIQTETVHKRVEVVADILCDLCGESCRVIPKETEGFDGPERFSHSTLKFHGHYWSGYDCLFFELSLCEKCTMEIFERRKTATQLRTDVL